MMLFLYNLLFPVLFIFFIPGMIIKLIRRPGHKATYGERFGFFTPSQRMRLRKFQGAIWIHSVSVGETMIALSLIRQWAKQKPNQRFIISTTTTTGQALARSKAPVNVTVIYCPLDFYPIVRRTFKLIKPEMLVIFETEIWPTLISYAHSHDVKLAMVNARMSDNSIKGYTRFKRFIAPLLEKFDLLCVQSKLDADRFASISPDVHIEIPGNMKFDQPIPENLPTADLEAYFGKGDHTVILAASTHRGEEKLIAREYMKIKESNNKVRLIIIPRHAEYGNVISDELKSVGLSFARKTTPTDNDSNVDCLLADTTGEMLMYINTSDIVVMGKSMAGHNEGHNLIEPALLAKPIVTGSVLKNFRFVLNVLKEKDALITIDDDTMLKPALEKLLASKELRTDLGLKAQEAILEHRGAVQKSIIKLGELI